VPGKEN
jgi:hypothetical protein